MVGSKNHSSAKNKPPSSRSGKDKISVARELGEALVGSKVRVWWPLDRKFYVGMVDSYLSSKKKHQVVYDDGDTETLDMKKEKWELIDDAEADEISIQDESADDSEEEKEKSKSGVKKAEKSKDVEKKTPPNPKTEKNGVMGDIGGKIVAAASRMSGMFRSKENGNEKETMKSSKKVSQSKNSKQKRLSSSSKAVSEDSDDAENDTFDDESMPLSPNKENGQEKEIQKSGKKVYESNKRKQKRSSISSEAVPVKKKPRTSSEKTKSNEDDTSDVESESKPLVSFLKKSPEAVEALIEKMKRKKEKEAGEGSCRKETKVEEESSS